MRLALIGKGISHSKSKFMYEKILGHEVDYTLLDVANESELPSLSDLFARFHGVSITTPYKRFYLDQVTLSEAAREIGAINCLKAKEGKFIGENTDYLAIKEILKNKLERHPDFKIVIIGSGVMSRVVAYACVELKIQYELFNRKSNADFFTREFSCQNLQSPMVLVNCCSRDYVFKNKAQGNIHFWDLNYNFPAHHYLKSNLHHFEDGLDLLERQAFFALQFWSVSK